MLPTFVMLAKAGSGSAATSKKKRSRGKPVELTPFVFALLKKLSEMRVYGDQPGTVASFIIRKEVMRLRETGVLTEGDLLRATQEVPQDEPEDEAEHGAD
jgi:hypothetical protein